MQIVNNYDKEWERYTKFGSVSYGEGVFNGEAGKIDDINEEINEIPVDEPVKELICIGNRSKDNMKIQLSSASGNRKYKIAVAPSKLSSHVIVESRAVVKPNCACSVNVKTCVPVGIAPVV